MATPRTINLTRWQGRRPRRKNLKLMVPMVLAFFTFLYLAYVFSKRSNDSSLTPSTQTQTLQQLQVDPAFITSDCTNLPAIRHTGLVSPDTQKVHNVMSLNGVEPRFHFGSQMKPRKVANHMSGDQANFQLISEHLATMKSTMNDDSMISFDIGANQGFYTYYLATLGVEVHSFEIDEENFQSLQHGLIYNPKDVADRVHLYPVGLSDYIGRSGQSGSNYDGFLKPTGKTDVADGPILSVTMDCFAHHVQPHFKKVAFVKIDVEGFEIAVLKGAQHSLLDPSMANSIGALLMEVGPGRWSRANIAFETGVQEMANLATHFQQAFVLIRFNGSFSGACAPKLVDAASLSDKTPKVFHNVHMHKVLPEEWQPLLTEMQKTNSDCNFWFSNNNS